MNIWNLYKGERFVKPLHVMPWRIALEGASHCLRTLVDTSEEHAILNKLLSNHSQKKATHDAFSSFYCHPLKIGSRFAKITETPLWYASLTQQGAFEEAAYYLKQFHRDTTAKLGLTTITLSTYQSVVDTSFGIDLTSSPFDLYQDKISSKETYVYSQTLGQSLRKAGVCAALYYSARAASLEKNVVVFSEMAWKNDARERVFNQHFWSCVSGRDHVEIERLGFEKTTYVDQSSVYDKK